MDRSGVSRRFLLTASTALAAGLGGANTFAAPGAAPREAQRFLADPTMNFETLLAIGESAYGAGELGETLAALTQSTLPARPTRVSSTSFSPSPASSPNSHRPRSPRPSA